jgi:type IV pilus assembly protein PilP
MSANCRELCEVRSSLLKVTLAQLKVAGIIIMPGGNKALVEDPSGKGYIVYEGTYIGEHFGRIQEILKDRIVVEEELEDFVSGKLKVQITELELRENVGEM